MKPIDYYGNTASRTSSWGASTSCQCESECAFDFIEKVVDGLPTGGGRLLDIGCQAGHTLDRLKDRFDECYGIDLGDYSEYWRRFPGVHFGVHDADSGPLPFPANHFDLVLCVMVLEHVFDVFGLVEEIHRVTARGGYAVIEVPNAGYLKHILSLLRGKVPRTAGQTREFSEIRGWDGQHLHSFTLSELMRLCRRYGFQIVSHCSRGKLPWLRAFWPSLLYASLVLTLRKRDLSQSQVEEPALVSSLGS